MEATYDLSAPLTWSILVVPLRKTKVGLARMVPGQTPGRRSIDVYYSHGRDRIFLGNIGGHIDIAFQEVDVLVLS
jgi:hypothetical protein